MAEEGGSQKRRPTLERQKAVQLPDDEVNDRLWGGAAADGWKIIPKRKFGSRSCNYTYVAPSGAHLSSKQSAAWAAADGGRAALRKQLAGPSKKSSSSAAVSALQAAEAEGLLLERSERSQTGFKNVTYHDSYGLRPFKAEMRVKKATVRLGYFETAEEAALCCARKRAETAA